MFTLCTVEIEIIEINQLQEGNIYIFLVLIFCTFEN